MWTASGTRFWLPRLSTQLKQHQRLYEPLFSIPKSMDHSQQRMIAMNHRREPFTTIKNHCESLMPCKTAVVGDFTTVMHWWTHNSLAEECSPWVIKGIRCMGYWRQTRTITSSDRLNNSEALVKPKAALLYQNCFRETLRHWGRGSTRSNDQPILFCLFG